MTTTKEEALARVDELEKKVSDLQARHRSEKEALSAQIETSDARVATLDAQLKDAGKEIARLKKLARFEGAFIALKEVIGPVAQEIFEEEMKKLGPLPPSVSTGDTPGVGTAELPVLNVNVDRPDVIAEDTSLRGGVAILLTEDFFAKPRSIGNTKTRLNAIGLVNSEKEVEAELVRFCQWRFLEMAVTDRRVFQAVEGAKERVKLR